MARFEYVAKTREAKTVKGHEDAVSKEDLVVRLRSKGLFIISIKETLESTMSGSGGRSAGPSARKIRKRSSVKVSDLALFARNLATTLSSGVTLLRSLEIIAHQTESSKLDAILKDCCKDIRGGLSFCEAIEKYPKIFSTLWVGIVRVGETSGSLPLVLDKLADFLELRLEFERKIKGALIYPGILMGASGIAILIFVKFIFPKFKTLFDSFDVELPAATKLIFTISTFIEVNFILIITGIALCIVAFIFALKRPEAKRVLDIISLKAPIVGKLTFLALLERFTSTIFILLESGLPLVYTLEVSAHSIGNSYLETKLLSITKRIRAGNSLSDELTREGIFPVLVAEMARIGEETGTMPQVFKKISIHYRKDLTTRMERLITAFEPLMIVLMGVVIGGIVIALFLPLFKLSSVH